MPEYEFAEAPFSTEALAEGIQESSPRRALASAKSNYASTLAEMCLRRLVFRRTRGDEAVPMTGFVRGLLETGTRLAPLILRILNEFGQAQAPAWRVLEQERKANDPLFVKVNIGCQIDGARHVVSTEGRERPRNVVEVKTVDPNIFRRLRSLDDLSLWPWMARHPDQLLLGMLGCAMTDYPGWLIYVNKGNLWDMKIFEVPFDWTRAESLIQRAEEINLHIGAGTLPAQINRPGMCLKCEYLHICNPVLEGDPDALPQAVDDGELAGLLHEVLECQEVRNRFEKAKKTLKDRLVPGQRLVCDGVLVDWKPHGKGWRMCVAGGNGEDDQVIPY